MPKKSLKQSLQIRLAFKQVFAGPGLINQAYFFVIVPFLSSLILSLLAGSNKWGLVTLAGVGLICLNVLYQLFLWSISFFYAQQIAAGDWTDYGLSLTELFMDLGVKLRLLMIRLVWYLPLLLAALIILVPIVAGYMEEGNWQGAELADGKIPLVMVLVLLAASCWWLLANNIFISLSNFIYSRTGSLLAALNLVEVFRLLFKGWYDYLQITLLWLLGQFGLALLSIPLALVALIPLVGGLMLGFVLGLSTMYNTLFLGNLQGQAWQKLEAD